MLLIGEDISLVALYVSDN